MSLTGYNYTEEQSATVQHQIHTLLADITAGELQVTFDDGNSSTFTPLQLHLHAPSEHTILNQHYDIELHLVHKHKTTGQLGAVIAIFFDSKVQSYSGQNASHTFLNQLIQKQNANQTTQPEPLFLKSLLAQVDFTRIYHYKGSLTTPPCTEGIEWFVVLEVQSATTAQAATFRALWEENPEYAAYLGNNRVTQELNQRVVSSN